MKGLFYRAYCINRYALLLPIFLYGMYFLTLQLMHVKKVVTTISGGSCQLTTQVQEYVESIHFYSAYWILKKVIAQFPCITNVSIIRTIDQTMYCDGTIKNIAYCVNKKHVITDDGSMLSALYFDPFLIAQAKQCIAHTNFFSENIPKILLFLNHIPEDIFSLYRISIENAYDVRLYPILSDEYYIKLTLENSFNQQIIHEAVTLIPAIRKQYSANYKNKQCIVIDMRFKDQIVFTKENKE